MNVAVMTVAEVEEMEPLDAELIGELVGEAAESLEDAVDGLENGAPLFVWSGDLRIDGDVSSSQLLAGRPGFEPPESALANERAFTIFVRGDLDVGGVLRVDQYHDLYVERDVRARSILGHTGNLVVKGKVTAQEIIAFECNEEGGFLHATACEAPLLCRFGQGGWEWAVSNQAGKLEIWDIRGDAKYEALLGALTPLATGGVRISNWHSVAELVKGGRATELLRALGAM